MKKSEAIIIGWINTGKPADCGETMKNQLMIQKLEELGVKCHQVDFKNWRKHPWVFLELAWKILAHRNGTIILSSSAVNIYPMLKLMKRICWKQNIVHWVIGGNLDSCIEKGLYDSKVFDYANWTLVESDLLKKNLQKLGISHVLQVPNFKPIIYYPDIQTRLNRTDKLIRFVFLSRIMPEKGCTNILNAARTLNDNGYMNKFTVDFYGKIADSYHKEFLSMLSNLNNVKYEGFLNLRESRGYDLLASYDVMLFPTYWKGEGFAGVFMDAFISGLPFIATDWAHNKCFLKDKQVALYIPVQDETALYDAMLNCIVGNVDLKTMAQNSQKESQKYNVDNVITEDLLIKINLK